jgi:hypothetical protein
MFNSPKEWTTREAFNQIEHCKYSEGGLLKGRRGSLNWKSYRSALLSLVEANKS